MGILFVVATPIGNLEDISQRALRTLRDVSLIAAEDTRHTGRLLAHFKISTPLISYHAFNERQRQQRLLDALGQGDVALVSDAGTPGLSDPGQAIVSAAVEAGFTVSPIPGPSAVTAAVSVSGLVGTAFAFLGFLPRKDRDRTRILHHAAATGFAVVVFEAPGRTAATLQDLARAMGNRDAAIFREITKLHEETLRGTLQSLLAELGEDVLRGEVVIVVSGVDDPAHQESNDDPEEILRKLLAAGLRPSEAAREAASITGLRRSDLYDLTQRIRNGAEEEH